MKRLMKKLKKHPRTKRKFLFTVKLASETGVWETLPTPFILVETNVKPIAVVVYEKKSRGSESYVTEFPL